MNAHQRRVKDRMIKRRMHAYVKWLSGVAKRPGKLKEGSGSNG